MHFWPFCEIISGKKSSYKIYEDDETLAFLDINPEVEGHTLIIPKKHVGNFKEIDGDTLKSLMVATQKVLTHYEDIGYCEGANILAASNVVADQSVSHFHIHLLPRHLEDRFDYWPVNHDKDPKQFELSRVYDIVKIKP